MRVPRLQLRHKSLKTTEQYVLQRTGYKVEPTKMLVHGAEEVAIVSTEEYIMVRSTNSIFLNYIHGRGRRPPK